MLPDAPAVELMTAPTSPFNAAGALDLGLLRAQLERQHADGVHGVFFLGTSAEFTLLDDQERLEMTQVALEVFGPDRTIVHCSGFATVQSVRHARDAVDLGARRLAFLPPLFLATDAATVERHFRDLAEQLDDIELTLYNNPARVGFDMDVGLVQSIVESCPNVTGIKLTGSSREQVSTMQRGLPGAALLCGSTRDFAWAARAGLAGVVSALANALPSLVLQLLDQASTDCRAASALQAAAERASALASGQPLAVGIRALMEACGQRAGHSRRPFESASSTSILRIRTELLKDPELALWVE